MDSTEGSSQRPDFQMEMVQKLSEGYNCFKALFHIRSYCLDGKFFNGILKMENNYLCVQGFLEVG
ncbi:MAG TPA: hypothetical protein DCQ97_11095 [Chitinophagaceae bacterium]|nr:hypothetical protein [Chitinophagaceae bacterium]